MEQKDIVNMQHFQNMSNLPLEELFMHSKSV